MKTLNEFHTFLTSNPGITVLRNEDTIIEFEVDHENGLSRKQLMNELMKYNTYKIKSTGNNTSIKHYLIYK